jgi:hypothetical protein
MRKPADTKINKRIVIDVPKRIKHVKPVKCDIPVFNIPADIQPIDKTRLIQHDISENIDKSIAKRQNRTAYNEEAECLLV